MVGGVTSAIAEIATNAIEISESVTMQSSAVSEIAASMGLLDTEASTAAIAVAELAESVKRTQMRVDRSREGAHALSERGAELRTDVHRFLEETRAAAWIGHHQSSPRKADFCGPGTIRRHSRRRKPPQVQR